ncbi:MAG: phage virion morphogenesis protein, partial [bacterium]|nr:phage virion morphogenesis protein [bacterium]
SAVIGSNLDYAAIHQLGGQVGKGHKAEISARPYLQLTDDDFAEIIDETTFFLQILNKNF